MLHLGHLDEANTRRLNCDITSAINMLKKPFMYSKTKHIPIKYHFLTEPVSQKVVKLEYVDTKEHIVISLPSHCPRKLLSILDGIWE